MNSLIILILSSIIVQFLVERVKDFFTDSAYEKITKYVKPSVFSLVFSLLISFGCQLDLFDMMGFTINPSWLAYILTAIALSGGSVAVNELIKSLSSIKENNYNNADLVNKTINLSTYGYIQDDGYVQGFVGETKSDDDKEETSNIDE